MLAGRRAATPRQKYSMYCTRLSSGDGNNKHSSPLSFCQEEGSACAPQRCFCHYTSPSSMESGRSSRRPISAPVIPHPDIARQAGKKTALITEKKRSK